MIPLVYLFSGVIEIPALEAEQYSYQAAEGPKKAPETGCFD